MVFYISADKQAMEESANSLINRPVKPLPDLDLSTNNAVMARFSSRFNLDMETGNKVFNPFEWIKNQDGRMVKKAANIAQVTVVTGITPLYFILSLESVSTNEFGARYTVVVEKQAAPTPSKRQKQRRYVSSGEKPNDTFALLDVKGSPENPDALVFKLVDSGETITVGPSQAYRRVDGYMADFRYDQEKKVFRARRAGDRVSFGGVDYVVFAINQNEVILEDQSNQKKTPLPFAP
jgi:hypothetical protein